MKTYTRDEIKQRITHETDNGRALVIGNAGLGMTAKFIERGGADFLTINAPAYYQMRGYPPITGCIAVTECNELVIELAQRMKNIIKDTPVIAGIYCNERAYGDMTEYFERLKETGYSGVMTYPTAAMEEGVFRDYLESASGREMEMACMKRAKSQGLYTIGFAMDLADAVTVARAGLDALVFSLGILKEDVKMPVEEAVDRIRAVEKAIHEVSPGILLFVAGGPIRGAAELKRIFEDTDAVGYMDGHFALPLVISEPIAQAAVSFKEKKLN